jgi:hypothetical protein
MGELALMLVEDSDIRKFLERMHTVEGMGEVCMHRNMFGGQITGVLFRDWGLRRGDIRETVSELLLSRFPEFDEVTFHELPVHRVYRPVSQPWLE